MEDSTLKKRSIRPETSRKNLTALRCTFILMCWLPLLYVMFFSYPKFAPIFEKLAARNELPLLTSVFVAIHQLCTIYYGFPIITAFMLLIGVDYYTSNPNFRSAKWFPWALFVMLTATATITTFLAFYSLLLPVFVMGNAVGA